MGALLGTLGPAQVANQSTEGSQHWVDGASLGERGYVLAWVDEGVAAGPAVYMRRFTNDGTPLGDQVRPKSNLRQYFTRVAVQPGGAFFVLYTGAGSNGSKEVYMRRYNPDGSASHTDDAQVNSGSAGYQNLGDVAVRQDGSFIVVFGDGAGCEGG